MRSQIEQILSSAARTTTGQSPSTYLPKQFQSLTVYIDVTAVTGTSPSMTVDYQVSPDDGTTWFTVSSTSAITAVGKARIALADNIGVQARLNYTITGTSPSFTFSAWLEGKAVP